MDLNNNLSEISAEMLLTYLYPELEKKWVAYHDGTFYRNYSRDAMLVDEEQTNVMLARDGFLRLLPEGMLFTEDELKGKDFKGSYERMMMKRRLFNAAFLPLDTFNFRQRLKIERQVSKTLDKKLYFILKEYFGFDMEAEQNKYVREVARLLPFIREWRADFSRLAKLLGELFHCKTRLIINRYSDDDNTRCWLPGVQFQLLIPNLTADEFQTLYTDTRPLEKFLMEWFMPAEVHFQLTIKHHVRNDENHKNYLLGYNIDLK